MIITTIIGFFGSNLVSYYVVMLPPTGHMQK